MAGGNCVFWGPIPVSLPDPSRCEEGDRSPGNGEVTPRPPGLRAGLRK